MATTQRDKAPAAAPASNGTTPELSTEPLEPVKMSEAVAAALREPFEPGQIGKLPRVTCRKCSQSPDKVCSDHKKSKCQVCNAFITSSHIHIDYVGHAVATDRLLSVDPFWTWEPFAYDVDGLPAFDRSGGLWVKLTIAGVMRPGYGDQTNGKGVKEVIGDAIRNGAMRFGVALDLWSKEDLAKERGDQEEAADAAAPARTRAQEPTSAAGKGSASAGTGGAQTAAQSPDERAITQAQRGRVWGIARDNGLEPLEMHEVIAVVAGVAHVGDIPRKSMDAVTESFVQYASDREAGAKVIAAWREQHAEMAAELDKNEATRLEELAGKDEPDPAEDDAPGGSYDS